MGLHDEFSGNDSEGVIRAPWERAFTRIVTPLETFIHSQTSSGLVLLAATVLALALANSVAADAYRHVTELPISLHAGGWGIEKTLHEWVNDGLMAFFFFLVGMELKRELLVGELADVRQAALPVLAAIGGMVVPACIYLAFNLNGDAAHGWGIPMATDIAFSVGILVLLGNRIPRALIAFLVALAIADDLGAVLVIGFYYTADLSLAWLASAAGLVAALIALNLAGVRRIVPYFCIAAVLWYALDRSGVHASLAGVLGAFTVPTRAKYDPRLFSAHVKNLIGRFDAGYQPGTGLMTNEELRSVVGTLETGIRGVESPLRRLTDLWHVPVAFAVVPIFALVNAGVSLQATAWEEAIASPVMLGVGLGLVLGKFVGIAGASWLALRLRLGRLPAGTRFRDIAGVSLLGGIGFTMSIFIAELAFAAHPAQLELAKLGILSGSIVAGVAGVAVLLLTCRRKA